MSTFKPSKYQEEIFDYIKNDYGNCVISACAGSGKTTSIVKAIELIPNNRRCLFIAFNKSIVGELNKRLSHLRNVKVSTFHSLGYTILKCCLGSRELKLESYKYIKYIKKNINNLSENIVERKKLNVKQYIDAIVALTDLSRLYLLDSAKEIRKIARKYNIVLQSDECNVVLKVLKWGSEELDSIDYTDMVWLPNVLNLTCYNELYDVVFADECQDFSIASIELFKKTLKRGARFVVVGDPNQAINEFAGSSSESFEYLCSMRNTKIFKLPISYRCSSSVIDIANTIVPDIKPRDNAPIGSVEYDATLSSADNDDMVLCRNKSTLIKVYNELISTNRKCYINGSDLGLGLIEVIKSSKNSSIGSLTEKGSLIHTLYTNLFDKRDTMMEISELDYDDATLSETIVEQYDIIQCIETISSTLNDKTIEALIKKIEGIFRNDSEGICISTIHKAKGLERDNVYLYGRENLEKVAKENQQERNLLYVAYTRAKENLYFLDEKRYKLTGRIDGGNYLLRDLRNIEETLRGSVSTRETSIEILEAKRRVFKEKINTIESTASNIKNRDSRSGKSRGFRKL